nr:MAG TPA: hypothetical protein [Caudoviricetes sp.]
MFHQNFSEITGLRHLADFQMQCSELKYLSYSYLLIFISLYVNLLSLHTHFCRSRQNRLLHIQFLRQQEYVSLFLQMRHKHLQSFYNSDAQLDIYNICVLR